MNGELERGYAAWMRLVDSAREAERERCAKIADEAAEMQFDDQAMKQFARDIATAIRT